MTVTEISTQPSIKKLQVVAAILTMKTKKEVWEQATEYGVQYKEADLKRNTAVKIAKKILGHYENDNSDLDSLLLKCASTSRQGLKNMCQDSAQKEIKDRDPPQDICFAILSDYFVKSTKVIVKKRKLGGGSGGGIDLTADQEYLAKVWHNSIGAQMLALNVTADSYTDCSPGEKMEIDSHLKSSKDWVQERNPILANPLHIDTLRRSLFDAMVAIRRKKAGKKEPALGSGSS